MLGWLGLDNLKERLDGFLPEGSSRARFALGTFWSVAGGLIAQCLGLAAAVLVARIFASRELYGQLGMLRNTFGALCAVGGLGLSLTAAKHVAQFRSSDPARAGRIIGLSSFVTFLSALVVSAAVFACAPWIAAVALNAPALATEIRIGCLIVFFEVMVLTQTGPLIGLESFRTIAKLNLIRGVAAFPLMTAGAWFYGLRGVMGAMAASSAVGWAVNQIALRRALRAEGVPKASLREARREMPLLWSFSLPAYLDSVLLILAPWAAGAILVGRSDAGYDSFGVFTVANQWQYPVTLVAAQMTFVLLAMLASVHGGPDDEARRRRMIEAASVVIVTVVLPAVALLACFAGPIMAMYGPQFAGARWVFWAVLFFAGVKTIAAIPATLLQARGAMWTALGVDLLWSAALLAAVWLHAGGPESYADAFSFSYILVALAAFSWCAALRWCSWSMALRAWLLVGVVAALSYGMGWVDSPWYRLSLVGASVVISLVCAYDFFRRRRNAAAPPAVPS